MTNITQSNALSVLPNAETLVPSSQALADMLLSMDEAYYSSIFRAGVAAYKADYSYFDCPWSNNTLEQHRWQDGFDHGFETDCLNHEAGDDDDADRDQLTRHGGMSI